jgi:GNAT superfamily N-acetyltransferase
VVLWKARGMDVRSYRSSDARALARLLGEMGYAASGEQAAEYAAVFTRHQGAALVVAAVHGEVVGVAASVLVPRLDAERLSCRITDLVVRASARRRGVGRALVGELETRAREAGATRLDLSTGDWRDDAHAFYECLGFVDNGARALVRRLA